MLLNIRYNNYNMDYEEKKRRIAESKTGKFTAEFNTSYDTLAQLAQIEWNLDSLIFQVNHARSNNGYSDEGVPFYVLMDDLFQFVKIYRRRLRNCMWGMLQEKEKKEWWGKLKPLYKQWKEKKKGYFPTGLFDLIEEYVEWLGEQKQQKLRLGIPLKKEYSTKEKLNRV